MSPRTKPPSGDHGRSVEVEWTTISYRTIAIYIVLAVFIIMGVLYLISPKFVVNTATQMLEVVAANPVFIKPNYQPEGSALRQSGWQCAREKGRFISMDSR